MGKTFLIGLREYRTTVLSRAFIFASFVLPVAMYAILFLFMFLKPEITQFTGTVAVVDETGLVYEVLARKLDPKLISAQVNALKQVTPEQMSDAAREMGGEMASLAVAFAGRAANPWLDQPVPDIRLERIAVNENIEAALDELNERLLAGELAAVIELKPEALDPLARSAIILRTGESLPSAHSKALRHELRQAVLEARLKARGLNLLTTQMQMIPPIVAERTMTDTGEQVSLREANAIMAMVFMMLLWISTMTGGQYLLTSTIEEKSSRIMEVLLSSVSPMQLMTGKVLGQCAVSLTMLAVYGIFGISAIRQTPFAHVFDPMEAIIMVPYFFIAFFFVACAMASVGAVVSEMRDAQAMMGPIIMLLILPMLAFVPIMEAPNGTIATVGSFIPPFTPFVMAIRLGSNEVIPTWQIVVSIAVGIVAVLIALRVTAKIFRIGVLMYGKPPNFRTMLTWMWKA